MRLQFRLREDEIKKQCFLPFILFFAHLPHLFLALIGAQVKVLDNLVSKPEVGVINLENGLLCLLLLGVVLHCGSTVPKGK